MILLQAGADQDCLLLWAEAAPEAPQPPSSPRGRKPKRPTARPSPFDAGAERLTGALASAFPDRTDQLPPTVQATAWLPTHKGQPVPSSPLLAPQPEKAVEAELAPWQVTVCPLPPAQALDVL